MVDEGPAPRRCQSEPAEGAAPPNDAGGDAARHAGRAFFPKTSGRPTPATSSCPLKPPLLVRPTGAVDGTGRRYNLRMAWSVSAQRAWIDQWRRAAVALAEQHRRELRRLSEPDALAASDALLSLAPLLAAHRRPRIPPSGLVEQQALFRRIRRRYP